MLTKKFVVIFFVDASVSSNGKVGAAIMSPNIFLQTQFKLPDGLSIYYAEAYAIYRALLYANDHSITNCCIISDCYRVLLDIKSAALNSSPHPFLINNIMSILTKFSYHDIQLLWLPGHWGNALLDSVDQLAKTAISNLVTEQIIYSGEEVKLSVDNWVWGLWKEDWRGNSTCKYQSIFNHKQSSLILQKPRKYEIIINRLRLLQTKLNGDLYKLSLHPDGMCEKCQVLNDSVHFLMNCSETVKLRIDIKSCHSPVSSKWTYQEILTNPKAMDVIVNFIQRNNIDI